MRKIMSVKRFRVSVARGCGTPDDRIGHISDADDDTPMTTKMMICIVVVATTGVRTQPKISGKDTQKVFFLFSFFNEQNERTLICFR